jgi:hypothetical protein
MLTSAATSAPDSFASAFWRIEVGFCANAAVVQHSKRKLWNTLVIVFVGLPY